MFFHGIAQPLVNQAWIWGSGTVSRQISGCRQDAPDHDKANDHPLMCVPHPSFKIFAQSLKSFKTKILIEVTSSVIKMVIRMAECPQPFKCQCPTPWNHGSGLRSGSGLQLPAIVHPGRQQWWFESLSSYHPCVKCEQSSQFQSSALSQP